MVRMPSHGVLDGYRVYTKAIGGAQLRKIHSRKCRNAASSLGSGGLAAITLPIRHSKDAVFATHMMT